MLCDVRDTVLPYILQIFQKNLISKPEVRLLDSIQDYTSKADLILSLNGLFKVWQGGFQTYRIEAIKRENTRVVEFSYFWLLIKQLVRRREKIGLFYVIYNWVFFSFNSCKNVIFSSSSSF